MNYNGLLTTYSTGAKKLKFTVFSSEVHYVISGVHQGSILGPLMFIVFFNDLKDVLNHCEFFPYADDTVILFAGKNGADIAYALNADLESIGAYCVTNELLLNLKAGKTESMLFGSSQRLSRYGKNLNITYENTPIIWETF